LHRHRATLLNMSEFVPFVLIVLAAVVVALLGLTVVRRSVPPDRLAQHTDIAGYVYAVIGVIYAVILAQVVIAAWEEYRDARLVAVEEAKAVLSLARLAQVWPDDDRQSVEDSLSAYARHVVNVEWPAMAAGEFDESLHTQIIHNLWRAVHHAGARIGNRDPTYAAALQELDALDGARRSRVLLGEYGLPDAMTLTLVVGAIVTVSFSYLFAVNSGWVHGLMTASLTTLVALLLLLQFQLELPFSGVSAIPPTAMELVIAEIDAGLGDIGDEP
jgi:Protein of unknown function (DUF4239)